MEKRYGVVTRGPGGVKLWDARTDELIHHWSGAGEVWWISFSHDGEQVFAADNKGVIRRWNARDGKELRRFDLNKNAGLPLNR